jgi:hypothetical protein
MENEAAESQEESLWEYGDIGFDTGRKLWFLQLTDKTNRVVNTRQARNIFVSGGTLAQYQWKDTEGRPFWHVRERFYARDIADIIETPDGSLSINFKTYDLQRVIPPSDFAYALYAYHLKDKLPNDSKAPMGFVEFFDAGNELISRIDKKWIILEGVSHRSVGVYPQIRMRAERRDLSEVVVTSSCVIFRGTSPI